MSLCLAAGEPEAGPWRVERLAVVAATVMRSGYGKGADRGPFTRWNHHIGSVVNALATAGLRIEFLHEYEFTDAPFQGLERGEDGLWRIPAD